MKKEQEASHEGEHSYLRALVSDWRPLAPDWRPTEPQRLWTVRIATVLGILVAVRHAFGITLWDWAKLLIVPVVIAGGGLWFNKQQRDRELKSADQRAEDDALQAYLGATSEVMISHHLRSPPQEQDAEDVRAVALA